MSAKPKKITQKQQEQINKKLAPVYRNIGGLTFAAGLIALLAGLRIDKVYGTQPIFTLVLVAISVPLVLFINSRVLRRAIAKTIAEFEDEKRIQK
jgi:uncharacterized membrane protein